MVQIDKPYADDLRNRFEETTTICFCVVRLLSGERVYTTPRGGLSQDDYGTIGPRSSVCKRGENGFQRF